MKIELDAPAEVSATLGSRTSRVQEGNEQQSFIRLTVMLPVNGQDFRVSVVGSTPSTAVLSRTTSKSRVSNKRGTTAQTRTLSTTNQETSTVSATDATTAGTQPTTPSTTRTSAGKETKKRGGRIANPANVRRDREIYKDRKAGMSYKEIGLKHGVTPEHATVIFGKMKKKYAEATEKARQARHAKKESA